ncbi:hypothetical protein JD844_009817, partial [Phrynosoma platyrhinos]
RLVWGNQETIWPLSSCALTSQPSSRIVALAKPKAKLDGAHQRRLVFSLPLFSSLKIIVELSVSLFVYSCGRESEIWHRPPNLYSIMPSKRILQLAEPRQHLDIYLTQSYCLSCCAIVETHVSKAAKKASASLRTEHLAQPVVKTYPISYDNRCVEAPIRKVNPAALQAVASPRITELAKAKALSAQCAPDRSPMWPVSAAAKHAVATPRLEELSQPPKRAPTHFVQFDPEAFTVKEAAKKAFCSERLKELAQPINR